MLMQTLQERIEELIEVTGWSVGKIASVADVSSSAVSQWLGRGGQKSSKSIGNLEAAMRLQRESGFSALWLAKGKGPKRAEQSNESAQAEIDAVVAMSKDVAKGNVNLEGCQVSPEQASDDMAENESAICQPIPTSMTYSAPNLKSCILLMASLVGALDQRSRRMVGDLMKDLTDVVDDPNEVKDIAEKASGLATIQKPISNNKDLNKVMRGRRDPVETKPAKLEH